MFKNAIRSKRQELQISQSKLAIMVRIPSQAMSAIELGKVQPWPKVRRDLAKVLKCKEEELFIDDPKR